MVKEKTLPSEEQELLHGRPQNVQNSSAETSLTTNKHSKESLEGQDNLGYESSTLPLTHDEELFSTLNSVLRLKNNADDVQIQIPEPVLPEQLELSTLNSCNSAPKNGHRNRLNGEGEPYPGEVFISVNTHKKFIRGEKLYLTRDLRRTSRLPWRKIYLCGLFWTVVAAVVLVTTLTTTGILLSEEQPATAASQSYTGNKTKIHTKETSTTETKETVTDKAIRFTDFLTPIKSQSTLQPDLPDKEKVATKLEIPKSTTSRIELSSETFTASSVEELVTGPTSEEKTAATTISLSSTGFGNIPSRPTDYGRAIWNTADRSSSPSNITFPPTATLNATNTTMLPEDTGPSGNEMTVTTLEEISQYDSTYSATYITRGMHPVDSTTLSDLISLPVTQTTSIVEPEMQQHSTTSIPNEELSTPAESISVIDTMFENTTEQLPTIHDGSSDSRLTSSIPPRHWFSEFTTSVSDELVTTENLTTDSYRTTETSSSFMPDRQSNPSTELHSTTNTEYDISSNLLTKDFSGISGETTTEGTSSGSQTESFSPNSITSTTVPETLSSVTTTNGPQVEQSTPLLNLDITSQISQSEFSVYSSTPLTDSSDTTSTDIYATGPYISSMLSDTSLNSFSESSSNLFTTSPDVSIGSSESSSPFLTDSSTVLGNLSDSTSSVSNLDDDFVSGFSQNPTSEDIPENGTSSFEGSQTQTSPQSTESQFVNTSDTTEDTSSILSTDFLPLTVNVETGGTDVFNATITTQPNEPELPNTSDTAQEASSSFPTEYFQVDNNLTGTDVFDASTTPQPYETKLPNTSDTTQESSSNLPTEYFQVDDNLTQFGNELLDASTTPKPNDTELPNTADTAQEASSSLSTESHPVDDNVTQFGTDASDATTTPQPRDTVYLNTLATTLEYSSNIPTESFPINVYMSSSTEGVIQNDSTQAETLEAAFTTAVTDTAFENTSSPIDFLPVISNITQIVLENTSNPLTETSSTIDQETSIPLNIYASTTTSKELVNLSVDLASEVPNTTTEFSNNLIVPVMERTLTSPADDTIQHLKLNETVLPEAVLTQTEAFSVINSTDNSRQAASSIAPDTLANSAYSTKYDESTSNTGSIASDFSSEGSESASSVPTTISLLFANYSNIVHPTSNSPFDSHSEIVNTSEDTIQLTSPASFYNTNIDMVEPDQDFQNFATTTPEVVLNTNDSLKALTYSDQPSPEDHSQSSNVMDHTFTGIPPEITQHHLVTETVHTETLRDYWPVIPKMDQITTKEPENSIEEQSSFINVSPSSDSLSLSANITNNAPNRSSQTTSNLSSIILENELPRNTTAYPRVKSENEMDNSVSNILFATQTPMAARKIVESSTSHDSIYSQSTDLPPTIQSNVPVISYPSTIPSPDRTTPQASSTSERSPFENYLDKDNHLKNRQSSKHSRTFETTPNSANLFPFTEKINQLAIAASTDPILADGQELTQNAAVELNESDTSTHSLPDQNVPNDYANFSQTVPRLFNITLMSPGKTIHVAHPSEIPLMHDIENTRDASDSTQSFVRNEEVTRKSNLVRNTPFVEEIPTTEHAKFDFLEPILRDNDQISIQEIHPTVQIADDTQQQHLGTTVQIMPVSGNNEEISNYVPSTEKTEGTNTENTRNIDSFVESLPITETIPKTSSEIRMSVTEGNISNAGSLNMKDTNYSFTDKSTYVTTSLSSNSSDSKFSTNMPHRVMDADERENFLGIPMHDNENYGTASYEQEDLIKTYDEQ